MSKLNNLTCFLTSLADTFRRVLESGEKINPQDFFKKVDDVYEKGKVEQYDLFWDTFLDFGNRTSYSNEFVEKHWNDDNFRPKYDLKIVGPGSNFASNSQFSRLKKGFFAKDDLKLDTSEMTGAYNFFKGNKKIKELGEIDFSSCTFAGDVFCDCESLEKISIVVNSNSPFGDMFKNCISLVDLEVSGTIGKSSSNLKTCTNLSKDSIISVINALGSGNGLSMTFSRDRINKVFETVEGMGDGVTSSQWQSLLKSRANWTISLI